MKKTLQSIIEENITINKMKTTLQSTKTKGFQQLIIKLLSLMKYKLVSKLLNSPEREDDKQTGVIWHEKQVG